MSTLMVGFLVKYGVDSVEFSTPGSSIVQMINRLPLPL